MKSTGPMASAAIMDVNERLSQALGLPRYVDWRIKDGTYWVAPVMNQGNCGSSVTFAKIATRETQVNISSWLPSLNVRLSPLHLFSFGGGAYEWAWHGFFIANSENC